MAGLVSMEEQTALIVEDELPQFEQRLDKGWNRLAKEVAAWAKYNWPDPNKRKPWLGIGEEAGELTHAILKLQQGIRGVTHEDVEDAFADSMIFMSHFFGEFYPDKDHEAGPYYAAPSDENFNFLCGRILTLSGKVIELYEAEVEEYAYATARQLRSEIGNFLALYSSRDLLAVTNEVWAKVQKRDWRKYPEKGRPDADVAA